MTSVGALTDAHLLHRLERASRTHIGKVLIPAGALAGIDALAAARLGGLERVRYTSRKLPLAWVGTPAEKMCDHGSLTRSKNVTGEAFCQNDGLSSGEPYVATIWSASAAFPG